MNCAAKVIDEEYYTLKIELLSAIVDSNEFDISYDGQVWYLFDMNGVQYSVHDLGQYQLYTGNVPVVVDCWWSRLPIQEEAFSLFQSNIYMHLVEVSNDANTYSELFEYV